MNIISLIARFLATLRDRFSPGATAASRLSEEIDREMAGGPRGSDPVIASLLATVQPRSLPPSLPYRSWSRLNRDLFGASNGRSEFSLPFGVKRIGHRGLLLACLTAVAALAAGLWRGPVILAHAPIDAVATTWTHVRHYEGDLQFVSRLRGYEMQWSGTQTLTVPDGMQLEVDVMGVPVVMTVQDGLGWVRSPLPTINQHATAAFPFLARALRFDRLIAQLESGADLRYLGRDEVLDQDCDVIAYTLPGPAAQLFWNDIPADVDQLRSGKIWVSRNLKMPIQVEMFGPDGVMAVEYRFTRMALNARLAPLGQNFPPSGTRTGNFTLLKSSFRMETRSP